MARTEYKNPEAEQNFQDSSTPDESSFLSLDLNVKYHDMVNDMEGTKTRESDGDYKLSPRQLRDKERRGNQRGPR